MPPEVVLQVKPASVLAVTLSLPSKLKLVGFGAAAMTMPGRAKTAPVTATLIALRIFMLIPLNLDV